MESTVRNDCDYNTVYNTCFEQEEKGGECVLGWVQTCVDKQRMDNKSQTWNSESG